MIIVISDLVFNIVAAERLCRSQSMVLVYKFCMLPRLQYDSD